MRRAILLVGALACIPWTTGCGMSRYVPADRPPQAFYQTSFPIHDTSGELERIFRSVKRIQVTGYYTTYRFTRADSITDADLRVRGTFRRATEQFTFDHSKSGTATIINRLGNNLTLITNDHVTRLPDTIVVYYGDPPGARAGPRPPRAIESVSIRTDQRYMVIGLSELASFRVTARDSANDIATISVDLIAEGAGDLVRVLRVPIGDPSRLSWGSFVYVLGYPRGYRMVTRGIVSDPNRTRDNSFLLDGLFNRGISGGLILAVRGDTGALEWVGMATGTSAQPEYLLIPERRELEDYGFLMPYEGNLYIERVSRIDYGITFSVPMTAIQRFLNPPRS
jgi:S1-C subfamily serine protease